MQSGLYSVLGLAGACPGALRRFLEFCLQDFPTFLATDCGHCFTVPRQLSGAALVQALRSMVLRLSQAYPLPGAPLLGPGSRQRSSRGLAQACFAFWPRRSLAACTGFAGPLLHMRVPHCWSPPPARSSISSLVDQVRLQWSRGHTCAAPLVPCLRAHHSGVPVSACAICFSSRRIADVSHCICEDCLLGL